MPTKISAEIICDSLSPQGHRLTTFVLEFPRYILAEFNTHRMLSRNSASSRAIPFEKMLERVKNDPFIPIHWMKEHKGMQGTEYFRDDEVFSSSNPMDRFASGLTPEESGNVTKLITTRLKAEWLWARDMAAQAATVLSNCGVHYHPDGDTSKLTGNKQGLTKQIVNRLLEPFLWHKVIVTGSEWENFFALRAHEGADIHIQELAYQMLGVYNNHTPIKLQPGEWHIPFGGKIDKLRLMEIVNNGECRYLIEPHDEMTEGKLKIATARCARISYGTFEGKDDYAADIALHDRLAAFGHFSPFEHCAKVMSHDEYHSWGKFEGWPGTYHENHQYGWCGNFLGFIQYRKTFTNENRTDARVLKP